MAHVVARTTPRCFCEVYDIMVPDYSSCANSKSESNLKSADFLTEARQFLGELAWLSRIRHLPLKASQKHRLPASARLYGRQWQHCLCFNTNACRRHARGQKGCFQYLICDISDYAYTKVRITLEITPYTAAGAVNPDGYHARNCGSTQPDQDNREPRLNRTSQTDIQIRVRVRVLNANNRPDQTVVSNTTQPHSVLC